MFGSGVNDTETMPYQVQIQSAGRYRTYNMAFRGYGPHQMLAMLEHEYEKKLPDCQPTAAIYQATTDHVRRAGGSAAWDSHGPRYVLASGGQAVTRRGNFDDTDFTIESLPFIALEFLERQLRKSRISARLFSDDGKRLSQIDKERVLAIVNTARNIFEGRYPGSKFYIILSQCGWTSDPDFVGLTNALYEMEFRVHMVGNILPDYCQDQGKYQINPPVDGHPTPLYYRLMAEYVIAHMLEAEYSGGA